MNKSIVVSSKQRVSHVNYWKPSAGIGGVPLLLLLQFLAILSFSSSFLIVCSATAFVNPGGSSFAAISPLTTTKNHPCCQSRPSVIIMSATNKPSGSFFNKVPDNQGGSDDDKNNDNEDNNDNNSSSNDIYSNETNEASLLSKEDPIEQSLQQLIKSRNSKPRASSPSTMGGIPTSKVKGFGKSTTSSTRSSPSIPSSPPPSPPQLVTKVNTPGSKKPFIGIGQPLNDINRPEYDDQGYTLYADEETGEKSRVFEALVEYPSIFKLKIIGVNESSFREEMVQIVAETCQVEAGRIKYTERMNGKWLSVTVHAPVENAEMLYALYENVDKDPRVKFKF